MRHLIDSCDRYIPFCLIVMFTVVSLCVCFNVFYLIDNNNNNNNALQNNNNNNNNALQNNNSEGLPVTYTDSLTYIKK